MAKTRKKPVVVEAMLHAQYSHERGELLMTPTLCHGWRIPLGEFLRGLGITLEDCRKALEES